MSAKIPVAKQDMDCENPTIDVMNKSGSGVKILSYYSYVQICNWIIGTVTLIGGTGANFAVPALIGVVIDAMLKKDWENSKEKFKKALLFDDYIKRDQKDIECRLVIDSIEDNNKELIKMDRRIFFDDRGLLDEDIDYGQVLLTKVD